MAHTKHGRNWLRSRWSLLAIICVTTVSAIAIRGLAPQPTAEAQTPQLRRGTANPQRGAQSPRTRQAGNQSPANSGGTNVVAVVNKEPITRQELGKLCLVRWGQETLESLVNKKLITEACQSRGIVITNKDIDEEIQSTASGFNMSIDQYLKMLKTERDISATEYRRDIIWPTIALKRLAADQLVVSKQDMEKEFEAEYGERIQVRMISMTNPTKAAQVLKLAKATPNEFARLAKEHSEDPNSASAKGLIPAVRRHVGDPTVEKAVFALQEGQISEVVAAANQYFIFRCERRIPPANISPQYRRQENERLRKRIVGRNLRKASANIFAKLQETAKVENVMNDATRSKQSPNVAAIVNGQSITKQQLIDECLLRYSRDMLDAEITYRLLKQELKRRNLNVSQQNINEEISRAALSFGYMKKDGSADLQAWMKSVTEKEGVGVKEYIRDAVWPSVALKQLVDRKVNITEDDLTKGFEANYGPRVEVLAIVLGNQRTAQEVWDMARKKPTNEFFGQLAEQYSIEPISRANFGEIPPIQRHGGQPQIEKEAFNLQPGEQSGIVAMGDKYIIMRCLGQTSPVVDQPSDVREELESDIREKKLRIAMSAEYDRLQQVAQIDNFLKGTSQAGATPQRVPVRPVSAPRP